MTVLTDKIAVVTGAGSGIGEAIATLLHEEGAKVGFFIFYGGKVKLPAFFNTQKAQLPL